MKTKGGKDMTRIEETTALLNAINESLKKGEVSDYEQVMCGTLLDITKSLAIIADGIVLQSEFMEKIKDDLSSIETRNRAKSVRWP